MKSKSIGYYLLSLFLLCSLYGCLQDNESMNGGDRNTRFFNAAGTDEWLYSVVAQLKLKNDSADFVTDFVNEYGYPLWKDAYLFMEKGNVVYAVPVKSRASNLGIESIWFFTVSPDRTDYTVYTRDMANKITAQVGGDGVEENWMFDYFTCHALHREPASGLRFENDTASTTSRMIVIGETTHCVHAFAGYEGAEADLGWHCWTTTQVNFLCDFGGGGRGSSGSGFMDGGYNGPGVGGGGVNPPDNNNNNDPASPCGKALSLSRNAALKEKVNKLFQAVHNQQGAFAEDGWTKTTTGEYIYPSSRNEGSMSYNASDLIGKKTTEQYHCHPSTGACYPSMSDLKLLATRYKNGNIDVKNFTYGVISVYGCLSMMITSEEAFRIFADKVLNNDGILRACLKMANIFF